MSDKYILNLTQREVDSYEWRKNSESKDPSYCGSTSFEHHIQQVRDPDSWVSESMLEAWEKEYIRDSQPPLPETVEKLQAKLDAIREWAKDRHDKSCVVFKHAMSGSTVTEDKCTCGLTAALNGEDK